MSAAAADPRGPLAASLALPLIETLVRAAVGVVFIGASVTKLLSPYEFLRQVLDYRVLPPGAAPAVAVVLPSLELLVGLMLLTGVWRRGALLLSAALLWLFVALQGAALSRGMAIGCGCFGGTLSSTDLIGPASIARTAVLAAAASALLFWPARAGEVGAEGG